MDKKQWVYLNNGLTPGRINKKEKAYERVRGMTDLTQAIESLGTNQFLVIPRQQTLYPYHNGWPMTGRDFKKRGNQFNLKIPKTKAEMVKQEVTPQQCIVDTVNKELQGLPDLSKSSTFEENNELYEKICRRGFKWDRRSGYLHAIMPQNDIMRGWRLASSIIEHDLDLAYTNPGGIFFIEVPSTKDDPKNRYRVKMYNFATELPEGLADWVTIDGAISGGDDFDKAMAGIDMYSSASLRYKFHEFNFNFQFVAASIMRAHYTDERYAQGKFKNRKRTGKRGEEQPIEPILLNIAIPPTHDQIEFAWKLDNNVLIEYKTSSSKISTKKLNSSEKESLYAMRLYLNSPERCYQVDEGLHGLDEVVARHTEMYKF
jgi:hypothetical protein|tara:strand:- start:793 stop:1911 length:1119 start_codon:yes stop_codon:yes gene_type:complete